MLSFDGVTLNLIPILTVIIQAVVAVVGGYLVKYLKAKYSGEQLKEAYKAAKIIALGVEQVGKHYGWESSKKKKQAVLNLTNYSKKYGLKLSIEDVDSLIESAVGQLNKEANRLFRFED